MSTSLLYFSLSVIMILNALPALFFPKSFKKSLSSFLDNENNLRMMAMFMFLYSLLLFSAGYKVALTANGILSLFAYFVLLKAVVMLYLPSWGKNMSKHLLRGKWSILFMALIKTLFSIIFFYMALSV